ncbi:MAG: chitobiase/beta-hexosaminidase C-terminal domain-containing protein [bacterium]
MKRLSFLLVIIFITITSCFQNNTTTPTPTSKSSIQTPQNLNGIPDPAISPAGTSNPTAYNHTVTISLSTPATRSVMHYTPVSTAPTCARAIYSAAFTVTGSNETKTVKAVACDTNGLMSVVTSAAFWFGDWETIANLSMSSSGQTSISTMTIYNNTPYLLYTTTGQDLQLKKYDGSSWINVGPIIGKAAQAPWSFHEKNLSLVIDNSGKIYVAYSDNTSPYRGTVVKRYDAVNSQWISLGSTTSCMEVEYQNISCSPQDGLLLSQESDGNIYLVASLAGNHTKQIFKYAGDTCTPTASDSCWLRLGPGILTTQEWDTAQLHLYNGDLYVGYSKTEQSFLNINKYDGNNNGCNVNVQYPHPTDPICWSSQTVSSNPTIINNGFSRFYTGAWDPSQLTYYMLSNALGGVTDASVKKYDSGTVSSVGGTLTISDDKLELTVSSDHTPYILTKPNAASVLVSRYKGDTCTSGPTESCWLTLGSPIQTASFILLPQLIVTDSNTIYALFMDGFGSAKSVKVMRFGPGN